jgi:hypothetical protein
MSDLNSNLGIQFTRRGINWVNYWASRYPSDLTLTVVSKSRIDLSWTNNGILDYSYVSIERSTDGSTWTEIYQATMGDTSYSNTGLASGTTYYYRVSYVKGMPESAHSTESGVTLPEVPTGLTLTLISGGLKIDWTDTNGATAQTEIWAKNDSGTYALAWTIAANLVTKSETVAPVDLRYIKIRAKIGTSLSAFTDEESIAMLGAELIDQANWYNAAYWNYLFQGNWSSVGNTLVSDGGGGFLSRSTHLWSTSLTYRTVITLTGSGSLKPLYGGTSSTVRGAGTYIEYLIPTPSDDVYIYSNDFNGSITALSIKQVLSP